MPLTWTEQYFDQSINDSSSGIGKVRGWKVPLSTPETAAADVQAPKFGEEHPDFQTNGLVVNNVSFIPQGRHTVVRASYVPKEFQDSEPPEDTTDLEFFKIDTTFKDVTVKIPVFQRVVQKVPNSTGGVDIHIAWKPVQTTAAFTYAQTVHRITLNAVVSGGAGVVTQLNISQFIHNQTNKLHRIGGVQYLFKADSIRRTKIDSYQFTYRWIHDPGVPNTLVFEEQVNPTFSTIGSYGFPHASAVDFPNPSTDPNVSGYVIPPYHRMDVATDKDDPSKTPTVVISPSFEADDNGHLTLPGVI